MSRKTTVLAWLPPMGHKDGIYSAKFVDFGIVLPKGVTPINWNPAKNSPLPVVLDQDYPKDFTDWRKHPNLFAVAVWNPTNWQEPDGRSFFGWRFMNRDENLDRWVAAKFEWDAANDEPDIVPRISTSLSCCPSDQNRYYAP